MTGSTLLIGAIASAASCMLCMEVGGISLKDTMVMPAHARKDVVHRQHQGVIRQAESIIQSSHDLHDADRRVRDASWPEKVLHISLAPADTSSTCPISSYSRTAWTNLRSVIRDGSGYGTVLTADGSCELLIVDCSRACKNGENIRYTIYMERSAS